MVQSQSHESHFLKITLSAQTVVTAIKLQYCAQLMQYKNKKTYTVNLTALNYYNKVRNIRKSYKIKLILKHNDYEIK